MRFRLWDINKQEYCKDYEKIADKISFVTVSEGSKFSVFAVNMPEFVTEFDTECMDKHHEPIFGNDRLMLNGKEYNVVLHNGTYVLYAQNSDKVKCALAEVAEECEVIGTVHDLSAQTIEEGK